MSDADRTQLAIIEETTYGEAVTGSNLQILRMVSEALMQETNMVTSAEIRSDRQVSDIKRVNLNAAGAINHEFSYSTYDALLEAGLLSADWSAAVVDIAPEITISASDTDNSFNDSGSGFANYDAGSWIKVSGFTTAANNGFFKIVTATTAKLVVSGGTLVTETAGDSVTMTQGAEITNGTEARSFNVERTYDDLSNELALYLGMMVSTLNLDITAEAIITGSFDFIGKSEGSITASNGTGYDAATTTEVMNAVDDVTDILENQGDYSITAMSLSLTNNLRARMQVGTLGAISIASGKINITGTVQAYYATKAVMDKYLNQTVTALAMVVEDSAGNAYIIDLPQVKYTAGQRVAGGENQDIIADMSFEAYMDPTELKTIRIVRFAA